MEKYGQLLIPVRFVMTVEGAIMRRMDSFFVCQNCGNRFTVDDIETKSGGCNPWPIFEEDKNVTDETVEISYDFLAKSEEIFQNWKGQFK